MDELHMKVYVFTQAGYDLEAIAAEVGVDAGTVQRLLDEVVAETAGRPGWPPPRTGNSAAPQRAAAIPESFTTRDGVEVRVLTIPADRVEAEWARLTTSSDQSATSPVILGDRPFPGANELRGVIEQSQDSRVRPVNALLHA